MKGQRSSNPIPNQPFASESKPTLKGPYWQVPLGEGLGLGGDGNTIESTGGGGGQPLPDFPPYNCRTDVNTTGVANFQSAWENCASLTSFPALDLSSGINFSNAWGNCSSLESFPLLDVSSGKNFAYAWGGCESLTSFPNLDVSSGTNFYNAWEGCSSLTTFPLLDVSSSINFGYAWSNCTSLTTFPAGMFDSCPATDFAYAWFNCALSQQSVDNILVSLDTAGQSNGTVGINGGTSSPPGTAGLAAKASLQAKGWTVTTN